MTPLAAPVLLISAAAFATGIRVVKQSSTEEAACGTCKPRWAPAYGPENWCSASAANCRLCAARWIPCATEPPVQPPQETPSPPPQAGGRCTLQGGYVVEPPNHCALNPTACQACAGTWSGGSSAPAPPSSPGGRCTLQGGYVPEPPNHCALNPEACEACAGTWSGAESEESEVSRDPEESEASGDEELAEMGEHDEAQQSSGDEEQWWPVPACCRLQGGYIARQPHNHCASSGAACASCAGSWIVCPLR